MTIETTLVRDVVKRFGGSVDVFRRYKIDYYRIGLVPLWAAAERQKCDLAALCREIVDLPENSDVIPTETRALLAFINKHYGRVFDRVLGQAVLLAHRLSATDIGNGGVLRALKTLAQDLFEHWQREQALMSAAPRNDPNHSLRFPVLRMMMEYDDVSDQLDTLAALMNDYQPPADASREWVALCDVCRVLDADLRFHMHLENNVLFPRYIGERKMAS